MKDKSRDAIRTVLKPSMYPLMLATSNGTCICPDCVGAEWVEVLTDLRMGIIKEYNVLNLSTVDGAVGCDFCGEQFSNWMDYSMDPHEAEMQEAADSIYSNDSDLDGVR